MYYIVYSFFYLLSLIPWRVMYFISDGLYGLVYYIIGYRKDVVMNNLTIAFPQKTEEERKKIAKQFYHQFIDTFLEMIKLISISDKELSKRFSSNIEVVNDLYNTGKSVEFLAGHFFNWEVINLGIAKNCKFPFIGVYMPLSNKIIDKIVYNLRKKYDTILIPATEFSTKFHQYAKEKYALGLAADQNPGRPNDSYWLLFFDRLTPFVKGPEKGAKKNDTLVFFANFYKTKRGYYKIDFELLTSEPNSMNEGELTKLFVSKVEEAIQKRPANYLWSHKRWKHVYDEKNHAHLVIK